MMPVYDLCVITRNVAQLGRTHLDVARAALEGGATIIQFRDKTLPSDALVETAQRIRDLTRAYGAALIINDRVDIALASGADGVHLGRDDLPIPVARRLLGPDAVIGASAGSARDALACRQAGASYLGVGPIFPTLSKPDAGDAIGLAPLAEIGQAVAIPVLAIGGITCDNMASVIRAGANGIAVIAAVAEAPDMIAATAALRRCLQEARGWRGREEQSA
jgi:thiamine-phosphate pyrophosphorylase